MACEHRSEDGKYNGDGSYTGSQLSLAYQRGSGTLRVVFSDSGKLTDLQVQVRITPAATLVPLENANLPKARTR